MSLVHAFDLQFLSALRVGAGPNDDKRVATGCPSDTLSAALVVAAGNVFGDDVKGAWKIGSAKVSRPLQDIAAEPPWVVSGLLPWVRVRKETGGVNKQGERRIRFVPLPANLWYGENKGFRRIAYVSTDLLAAPRGSRPCVSRCGTLAHTTEEIRDVVWDRQRLRSSITVDRTTSASDLFHLQERWLGGGEDAGATLLVHTPHEEAMNLVHTLLRHLADSGIGADVARGLGRFKLIRTEPLPIDEAAVPRRRRLLLGCASPDAVLLQSLSDESAAYTIVRRSGRAHGRRGGLGLARKTLRLLAPGSVIPDQGLILGKVREVTPAGFTEHPIYRDGRTLGWPLPESTS